MNSFRPVWGSRSHGADAPLQTSGAGRERCGGVCLSAHNTPVTAKLTQREPRVGGRTAGPTSGCPSVNRQDAAFSLFRPSGEWGVGLGKGKGLFQLGTVCTSLLPHPKLKQLWVFLPMASFSCPWPWENLLKHKSWIAKDLIQRTGFELPKCPFPDRHSFPLE